MYISFQLPLVLVSTNQLMREHWAARARRVKAERMAIETCLRPYDAYKPDLATIPSPLWVSLLRVSPRKTDDDNLRGCQKGVRDQIAAWLGVPDNDPRIVWEYLPQEKGEPKQHLVVVTITHDGPQPADLYPTRRIFTADEVELGVTTPLPKATAPLVKRCGGSGKPCEPLTRVTCLVCGAEVSTRAKGDHVVREPHPAGGKPARTPVVESASPDEAKASKAQEEQRGPVQEPMRAILVAYPSEQDGSDELVTRSPRSLADFAGAPPYVWVLDNGQDRKLVRHDFDDDGKPAWLYFETSPPVPMNVRRRDGSAVARIH